MSYGSGGFEAGPGLTPKITRQMTRCGVDLTGFDQLLPGDGRLAALAWSWAPRQPRRSLGRCAIQRSPGRWRSASCRRKLLFACQRGGHFWVDRRRGRYARRRARCGAGARLALPRTGFEAQRLREAISAAGVRRAWLRYRG